MSTDDGERVEETILFPIYSHVEDADSDQTWIFPLYRTQTLTDEQGNEDSDWFVPSQHW